MNLLAFLLVGGIIDWIASIFMRTDTQQGVILNILAGIIGSGLGGLLLAPALGIPPLTQGGKLTFGSLGVSLGGTVILFALWNMLNKGRVR